MRLPKLIRPFASLKLTLVCLGAAIILVFAGTLAQVDFGLYRVQTEFFRRLFVYWQPKGASWRVPVFPGGYLIGSVLLINLLAAHLQRFGLTRKKIGINLIHAGLILLLVGQLATDMLSVESNLHLRNGETKNYSENDRRTELAIIDVTTPADQTVVAVPDSLLARPRAIQSAALPFAIQIKQFWPNSTLGSQPAAGFVQTRANAGAGPQIWLKPVAPVTEMDKRDLPSALVELTAAGQSLGTWLVSAGLTQPQPLHYEGRTYTLALRPRRHYLPCSVQLLRFNHDVYRGTAVPKDFSSVVQLRNPDNGENRQVRIFMNNPLRYHGCTFYQASFDADDHGSILEVVRNPTWRTPYLACLLVGAGLLTQFLSHLVPFLKMKLAT